MRCLLVTSRVTFIPENYNRLVLGLADHPNIAGLVILDNSEMSLAVRGIGFAVIGAHRTGMQLTKNQFFDSMSKRKKVYEELNKSFHILKSMNNDQALQIVQDENIDLIINARTRCIYKSAILNAPRLGCINIHHGILPEQRGTMCDLWALSENDHAGFTVHEMNEKIDDGGIIHVEKMSQGPQNYQKYLLNTSSREADVIRKVLADLESNGSFQTVPNVRSDKPHRKNPTVADIKEMKRKGMIL